jgi:xylulose-5-phosphate/fructose-6-phosphate phosphoketolase
MLFRGYGWTPYFVEGSDLDSMHQAMAATLERCVTEIKAYQKQARDSGKPFRPRWPMIVLRSPKGWTGPSEVGGHHLEGFWRAHQVPMTDVATSDEHLKQLEAWMRSYKPDELFDAEGRLVEDLRALAPEGDRRMSSNPVTNGGNPVKPLDLPKWQDYALQVDPGVTLESGMANFAKWLRDVVAGNMTNFRLFGPDETESNKLGEVYKAGKKVWLADTIEYDEDGGNLSPTGRVMEMLSEHTVEGWLEGYILAGGHGLLNSYEPFIHIIGEPKGVSDQTQRESVFLMIYFCYVVARFVDSMVGQHCKVSIFYHKARRTLRSLKRMLITPS